MDDDAWKVGQIANFFYTHITFSLILRRIIGQALQVHQYGIDEGLHHVVVKIKSLRAELLNHGLELFMSRKVSFKRAQQHLQVHDRSLRVDIVDLDMRQEHRMHILRQFINQNFGDGHA